jgi:hypothetical protein
MSIILSFIYIITTTSLWLYETKYYGNSVMLSYIVFIYITGVVLFYRHLIPKMLYISYPNDDNIYYELTYFIITYLIYFYVKYKKIEM